jgi:uncharacterized protein (DUF58 family)
MDRVKPRYQYHLHGALLAYVLVTLLIAAGAFNSNNNLLFFLFGLSMALLVIGGIYSGATLMRVGAERVGTHAEPAGGAVRIRVRLRHTGRRLGAFALAVSDQPDPDSLSRLATEPAGFVPAVGPGQTVEVQLVTRSTRRGELRLRGLKVASEFPFGLVRKSVLFASSTRLVIPPAAAEVPEIARRLIRGRGREPWPDAEPDLAILGDEFAGLREYSPGDSPRLIAWRASARLTGTDRPWVVRQHAGLPRPGAPVVVRVQALGSGAEADYERCIAVAAAVVRLAADSGLPVGLEVDGPGLSLPPRIGRRHAEALVEELALLPEFELARARPALPAAPASTGRDTARVTIGPGGATTVDSAGPVTVKGGAA